MREMKRNLLIVAALGGMLWSANDAKAQETVSGIVVEETPVLVQEVDCKDYYTPGSWKNNWFIQLGAGIRSPFMENYRTDGGDKSRHLTAVYNLGVGRWISPYLGFRFSAYYGSMHWNQGVTASARVANLNVDFMWDMFNSIGGYKADRVFSIVPSHRSRRIIRLPLPSRTGQHHGPSLQGREGQPVAPPRVRRSSSSASV